MIKTEDIQQSVADILFEKTGYRVYTNEVLEGFKAPCFFVEVKIGQIQPANRKTFRAVAEIGILYFSQIDSNQRVRSEILLQEMMSKIALWFMPYIRVGDRALTLSFADTSFTGEDGDILSLSFSSAYFDSFEDETGNEPIETVNIAETISNK